MCLVTVVHGDLSAQLQLDIITDFRGYVILPSPSRTGLRPEGALNTLIDYRSDSKCRLLFASVVLGMGTDQKELYRVTRIGQPPELGAWAQEFGRAGRDGKPAEATLYWMRGRGLRVEAAMKEFMRGESCLRMLVVHYYDPSVTSNSVQDTLLEGNFKCCSVCDGQIVANDLPESGSEPGSESELQSESETTD